jgi:ABC-2 type transport system permease protein
MTGVGAFLWTFLRRDRWMYVSWGLGVAVFYWSQAVSVEGLYTTQAEFDQAAASMAANSAFVAMAGPARALNTLGGQVAWQATAFGAILAGLMSMFLVGRHTRAEEESSRDEILRAAPVDRHASLTAAILDALLANAVLGALVTLSLVVVPLRLADSLALGVGLTLAGWCFTGASAMAAQVTSSTRGMYGIVGALIAASYAVRAVGDVGNPALSWLSPLGWYQAMHAFSGLRWWPALLLLGLAAASTAAAYRLFAVRDFGSGLWAGRPGAGRADDTIASPFGLAWRLQRASLVGWAAGTGLYGIAFGSIGNDVGTLLGTSRTGHEVFVQGTGDVVDGFYAVALVTLALMASGFALASALRPHGEEDAGRVEPLLGTGLSRVRWALGHVAVTVLGSLSVLASGGLGLGLGFWLVTHDPGRVGPFVAGAVGFVAPMLVLSGVARLLWGLAPRWCHLAWLGLVLGVGVLFFGPVLRLPGWLQDLSPFHHMALVPAEPFRWSSFAALLGVAAALSAAGVLAFAHRDLD